MPGRTRSRTPVDPKKKQLRIYKERLAGLLTSIAHTSGAEKAKLEEDAEALRQKIPDAQVTAHSAAQINLAVFRRLHHFRYLRATQQRAVAPLQKLPLVLIRGTAAPDRSQLHWTAPSCTQALHQQRVAPRRTQAAKQSDCACRADCWQLTCQPRQEGTIVKERKVSQQHQLR